MIFSRPLKRLALIALALFMLTFALGAFAEEAPGEEPEPEVNVTHAAISLLAKTLEPGETFSIEVLSRFPSGQNEPLLWKTSNGGVASIDTADASGPVTVAALKNGRSTISLVGSRSGTTLAKCQVTVRTVKITSFSISPRSLTLAPTQKYTMKAVIKPASATYKTVTWTSSKPEVLSFSQVSESGQAAGDSVTVYARAEGRATLTAVTDTGRRTTRVVTVKDLAIRSVKLPSTKTIYLEAQTKTTLTATVSPALAAEDLKAVVYSSSDESIVKIEDPSSGELTPLKTGRVTITAVAGGKSDTCRVTVSTKAIKSVSVSTADGDPAVVDIGDTLQLTATVSPSYAADRSITWSSENDAIATVDGAGLVTARAAGIVKIRCQSVVNSRINDTLTLHVRGDDSLYKSVTITAAGDAVLGGDQRKGGRVANPRSYQAFKAAIEAQGDSMGGKVFENVKTYFSGDDNIVTFNLEGTLTLKTTRDTRKPFVFQGHPNYAKTILAASGIDAVNLANNHTYDVGKDGYEGTMRALRNAGVKYFGNRVTSYVTKNGVKVAFVGYVSKKILISRMKSEIQSAAKKADVVVVTFHWTDVKEFNYAQPSSRQRSLARSAINYGADLVLGAHTHRLNGIERYKGKYIVYDLGNFVTMASNGLNKFGPSNPNGIYDYDSMIYQQRIRVWQDGFVEPADIKIIPCAITSQYADLINDAQPTPYETGGTDYQRVMERIRTHSPSDYADYPINGD